MSNVEIVATIAPEFNYLEASLQNDLIYYQYDIDIIELRIDQWQAPLIHDIEKIVKQIKSLDIESRILVTYRRAVQGGQGSLDEESYLNLLSELTLSENIDLIDIEWYRHLDLSRYGELVKSFQKHDIGVLISHHNFKKTPKLEEMQFIYYNMQKLAPDYIKLAVMPHHNEDVSHLLQAMSVTANSVESSVVGIAMSKLGLVSRTAQGVFGGSLSYGCLGKPQAPGQIHVSQLKQQIEFYK